MGKYLVMETIRALAYVAMLGVILVGVAVLAGCNADKWEGDGFYNSGRPAKPACVKKDANGNEHWFTCQ